MIKLLIKLFIKNSDDVNDLKVREKYNILGGILGIICNIFLFVIKLIIGIIMNSISILSDSFNNLSDMFSSGIGIFSAKLASKKPDKKHPFGHGRIEYVATLIIAFLIILVGIELFRTSAEKIILGIKGETSSLNFSLIAIIILSFSILIKLWMFYYNLYLSKKINSSLLKATAFDSLSDILTSLAVIISTLISYYFLKDKYFYLDGGISIIIAIFIGISGIKIVISTIDTLLGNSASIEDMKKISNLLVTNPHVLGIHDLVIHDYGPGRKMATVHCEVAENENFSQIHEIIDKLEIEVAEKLNIELVIHMDPIDTTSPYIKKLNQYLNEIILSIDSSLSFHDLRITNGENNINVIFDLLVPYEYSLEKTHETIDKIQSLLKEKDKRVNLVCKIDHSFILDN